MKRKILTISVLLILIALIAAGSLAYFTAEGTAQNVITAGTVDIQVLETQADGSAFPTEGVCVMPGDTVSKIVTVENRGSGELYLRVKLTASVENSDLPAENCLSMDVDTEKWTLKDGYYYYFTALPPGGKTTPIFRHVVIDGPAVGNDYRGKAFLLAVDAQAVQAANNGVTVWDAIGWPEM